MATALAALLSSALRDVQNTRYSELASSAIIVYDHLITVDQEVEHVWRAPWTIGKVLFLLNRYYSLFVVSFNNYGFFSPRLTNIVSAPQHSLMHFPDIGISCSNFFKWQGWTGLIACALAEITLQVRLYALYYGSKRILALMVCSFIAVMATSAVIMGTTLHGIISEANLIPGVPFCVPINPSPHFYAFWIPILAFETLLCSLALFRGYKSYKDHELKLRLRRRKAQRSGETSYEGRKQPSILAILLRDSVAYFIVMFATYFTTTMIWIFAPSSDLEIPIGFTVTMSCVMCNRLLLNLRSSRQSPRSDLSISAQARSNTSRIRKSQAQTVSSRAHLTNTDGALEAADVDRPEDIVEDIIDSELDEYELHTLRTLKPHRSVRSMS